MLVVGMVGWSQGTRPTNLTPNEQLTHMALWALQAAPLLIGADLSKLDDWTTNILGNREMLAVNQDVLGKAASRKMSDGWVESGRVRSRTAAWRSACSIAVPKPRPSRRHGRTWASRRAQRCEISGFRKISAASRTSSARACRGTAWCSCRDRKIGAGRNFLLKITPGPIFPF
jgi:hypothetical protein